MVDLQHGASFPHPYVVERLKPSPSSLSFIRARDRPQAYIRSALLGALLCVCVRPAETRLRDEYLPFGCSFIPSDAPVAPLPINAVLNQPDGLLSRPRPRTSTIPRAASHRQLFQYPFRVGK